MDKLTGSNSGDFLNDVIVKAVAFDLLFKRMEVMADTYGELLHDAGESGDILVAKREVLVELLASVDGVEVGGASDDAK